MTQFLNFKSMEVVGATKEEALAKAPFDIMGDATQAYKSWKKQQNDAVTSASKRQFMLDYLSKKSKNVAGVGFVITNESAVVDTRERPYKIEDVKDSKGTKKFKKFYQLIDDASGVVLAETDGTKAQAKELAKQLYTLDGYKGNLRCQRTKKVVEGESVAFTATYTPSAGTKPGNWLVFGIERG